MAKSKSLLAWAGRGTATYAGDVGVTPRDEKPRRAEYGDGTAYEDREMVYVCAKAFNRACKPALRPGQLRKVRITIVVEK